MQQSTQKHQVTIMFASIITMLADIPDGAPSGIVYTALQDKLNVSYTDYMDMINALFSKGYIDIRHDVLLISDTGKQLAARIEQVMQGGKG